MAAVAWPLIILIVVMFILIIIASAFILVRYQHPDEATKGIMAKIVFIFGLAAAFINVLLLPLDVANRNSGSTLDMLLLLYIVYGVVIGLVLLVVPFALCYYEAEDAENNKGHEQVYTATCYTLGGLVIFGFICGMLYAFLGQTHIPVRALTARLIRANAPLTAPCINCTAKSTFLSISVSLLIYIVSLLAFIGLILMVCYGGVGLVALPVNLINDFVTRPEKITLEEYMRRKTEIGVRASTLLVEGTTMEQATRAKGGKKGWNMRRKFNRFKRDVLALEKDFRKNNEAYRASTHPYWYYIKLILGVIGIGMSALWLIHILLYMILFPPASLFLNQMFSDLDNVFQLFGTSAYFAFSFYLLWAVIKGQLHIGMRFLIVNIHPMVVGETLLGSLLFNVMLLLLSSVAVTVLSVQVSSLRYTTLLFKNSKFFLFCICLLATIWYCMCGVREAKKEKKDAD